MIYIKEILKKIVLFVISYFTVLVPAVSIGMLAGTYPGYKAFEFVWDDARFCLSCHVHDYANDTWAESSHGKLTTCHDCHHQPLTMYMMEPVILILHQPKFPKDLKHVPHVPNDLCESCHLAEPPKHLTSTISGPLTGEEVKYVPKVDKLVLHKIHLEAKTHLPLPKSFRIKEESFGDKHSDKLEHERNLSCVDCHGAPPNQGHDFTATDASCVRCHQNTDQMTQVPHFNKAMSCRNCHFLDFLKPIE